MVGWTGRRCSRATAGSCWPSCPRGRGRSGGSSRPTTASAGSCSTTPWAAAGTTSWAPPGPAFAALDDAQLARAVELAERVAAEGDPLLRELDAQSLAWRGKRPKR